MSLFSIFRRLMTPNTQLPALPASVIAARDLATRSRLEAEGLVPMDFGIKSRREELEDEYEKSERERLRDA